LIDSSSQFFLLVLIILTIIQISQNDFEIKREKVILKVKEVNWIMMMIFASLFYTSGSTSEMKILVK
jgi:hypothetical protein